MARTTQVLAGEAVTTSVSVRVQLGRKETLSCDDGRQNPDIGANDLGGRCSASRVYRRVACRSNGFWCTTAVPMTNKLQRVLNAVARVVTGTRKFDRGLSQLLHTELHWLDVPV